MKQMVQNIQDRLVQKVPVLKYVDQDWGQMDFWREHPVKYPCALIDVQSAGYTNDGKFHPAWCGDSGDPVVRSQTIQQQPKSTG